MSLTGPPETRVHTGTLLKGTKAAAAAEAEGQENAKDSVPKVLPAWHLHRWFGWFCVCCEFKVVKDIKWAVATMKLQG